MQKESRKKPWDSVLFSEIFQITDVMIHLYQKGVENFRAVELLCLSLTVQNIAELILI